MPLSADLLALLNACRANPADDLPRLVLADWLDEHDDPARADLIRVQCDLARPSLDAEHVAALKLRERALIAANWRTWVGGLHEMCCDWIDQKEWGRFAAFRAENLSRGRTASGNAVAPTIDRGDPFLAPLPWAFTRGLLCLTATTETVYAHELRRWAKSEEVAWLDSIRLPLTQSSLYRIARSNHAPRQLHGLVRVELTISTCEENSTLVADTAGANYGQVTRLRLDGADCSAVAAVLVRKKFIRLVNLEVGGAGVPAATLLALARRAPRVNVLSCYRTPFTPAEFAALLASPWGETLHTLEVMNCGLGDAAIPALVGSGLLGRLYGPQLNLSMNPFGDIGLSALAGCEDLLRFSELILRECHAGDAGVEALAASPFAANLRYVDLWKNRLTDRAAAALAASPHLMQVRDLNVRDNRLTDRGRAILTERYGAAAKVGF